LFDIIEIITLSLIAGDVMNLDNSLYSTYPELSNEWHPTMNGELTPKDITYGSGKKVWWLCKNKKHDYDHLLITEQITIRAVRIVPVIKYVLKIV
jgi:hypothetical protein